MQGDFPGILEAFFTAALEAARSYRDFQGQVGLHPISKWGDNHYPLKSRSPFNSLPFMCDSLLILPKAAKLIGIAADHGGFDLKYLLTVKLRGAGHTVIDFGDRREENDDDYPDFVVPLARAVASGDVTRGVAICGSGVGAAVAANKVNGVRACLIHESYSAHQGVEDDDLNMICLGGLVTGHALAWELVQTFLNAGFHGAERHRRRLDKLAALEQYEVENQARFYHHENRDECWRRPSGI